MVKCVVHNSEFTLEHGEQFFPFLVRSRFVSLHGHKHEVVSFGFFVGSEELKGFGKQLDLFLIVGDDERVV